MRLLDWYPALLINSRLFRDRMDICRIQLDIGFGGLAEFMYPGG